MKGLYIFFIGSYLITQTTLGVGITRSVWSLKEDYQYTQELVKTKQNTLFETVFPFFETALSSTEYKNAVSNLQDVKSDDFIIAYGLNIPKEANKGVSHNFIIYKNMKDSCLVGDLAALEFQFKIDKTGTCSLLFQRHQQDGMNSLKSNSTIFTLDKALQAYGIIEYESSKLSYRQLKLFNQPSSRSFHEQVQLAFTGENVQNSDQFLFR